MPKIMLVEDDNNLREIYGERLTAEGYEIISAGDGEEALALAVKEKPDLIISDVMMPKISGFYMLDILRQTPETKNTKVIMMTALSQTEDKDRADKLGADKYLVKSQVTLEDVARVVHDMVYGADQPAGDAQTAPAMPAASETPTDTSAPAVAVTTPEPPSPAADPMATSDVAVAPEPSAAAEPAQTSVTSIPVTSVDEPAAVPSADATTAQVDSAQPMTTAQEEAEIARQIDTFVATNEPEPKDTSIPPAPEPMGDDLEPAGARKKTIEPITEPGNMVKPDINALYEKEMASEAAATPAPDMPPVATASAPDVNNAPADAAPAMPELTTSEPTDNTQPPVDMPQTDPNQKPNPPADIAL